MKTKTSLIGGAAAGIALAIGAAATAQAQETTITWPGAPRFTNDQNQFKFRGRILVDSVFQDFDRTDPTKVDASTRNFRGRQAFLGVEGQLNSQWAFKAEGGWVNGATPTWDDVVIEYKPTETSSIMVGNIKSTGMENITSTRFLTFMERGPYANISDLDYYLGVVGRTWGPNWSITAAFQGDKINNADVLTNGTPAVAGTPGSLDAKERLQEAVRVTFLPIMDDNTKVHVGGSFRHRDHGSEAGFSYTFRPNTSIVPAGFISGATNVAKSDNTFTAEGMIIHKSFSVQGEYQYIKYDGALASATTTNPDGHINAGYVYVSWWPTGETRNYQVATGDVGRPKILNPITGGGWGGVELAARYDWVDLSHAASLANVGAGTNPGTYHGFTGGLNYYPFPYVRFMFNYTNGKQKLPVTGVTPAGMNDVKMQVFAMRAQVDW